MKKIDLISENNSTRTQSELRSRILGTAAALFQSNGYFSTSMHDIKKAAEVTGGALYYYFPTKKSLALAVVSEIIRQDIRETWIEVVSQAPRALHGIKSVFTNTIQAIDNIGSVLGCPLNNLSNELSRFDIEIQDAISSEFEIWRAAICSKIEKDIESGDHESWSKTDIQNYSYFVVALFSGAMAVAKCEQNSNALKSALSFLEK